MGKGYMGKVLWVDLSQGTVQEQVIPDEVYERFMAGYGLAAKLLWDRIPAGADPLGPDNVLGFVAGLLTGTGAHFAGRWQVVAKSPLTGGWGDANCGGDFAPAIKRAGVDGIFFTGESPRPVYLLIEGDERRLLDAGDLWGQDAIETEDRLQERHGKASRVACIGPAGERLSLISGVVNARGRLAARSGLGAVMGSKRLKALVLKGKEKVELHDRDRVLALSKAFRERLERDKAVDRVFSGKVVSLLGRALRRFKTQPAMAGELFKFTLRVWGTSGITAMAAETGDSPVQNWKGVGFRDFPLVTRSSRVGDDAVTRYEVKKYRCHSCPLACGGICSVKEGQFPIEETHKPEYETLGAFGALILVDDLHVIFQINEELNRAGMDTISAGVTVAWAFEAFERGLLTTEDTGGLQLRWGDAGAALELVRKMIAAEGIGAWLKDGVQRAAQRLGKGSEEFAMHAGGQELPMHDPRYDAGYGLAYEVEPTPGRHTIHSYTYTDLMALHRKTRRMPKQPAMHNLKDRMGVKGKGEAQSIVSNYMELGNGCGMCVFGLSVGGDPPVAEWINAATGWEKSFEEYLSAGHRIKTLRHAFNLREGIRPPRTTMPARARGVPPLDAGPLGGLTPAFDELRQDFYRAMGWDPVTAIPLVTTLEQLGLQEVKAALY
ncbi:MAG: aldehyde ferredoxin oxidoreductase family protein [Polyangia bacterium]|jgi:aldehyde:ferredoxin oxidoreductase|nr:aldehyde ferredoxin oxidoreductase family protein [Polyangia bacterium]